MMTSRTQIETSRSGTACQRGWLAGLTPDPVVLADVAAPLASKGRAFQAAVAVANNAPAISHPERVERESIRF